VELAPIAIAHTGEPLASRLRGEVALEASLQQLVVDARAAWPGLDVPADELVRFIAERADADGSVAAVVAPAHAADLYLACACSRGDLDAIAAFEVAHLCHVPAMIARLDPTPELVAEVQQVVRTGLFVALAGKRPRIAEYAGRGKLHNWLRIAAVREGIRLLERAPRDVPLDDTSVPEPAVAGDPELRYMRTLYGAAFRRAFRAAFGLLAAPDRELLRAALLEGFAIDRLAAIHGVHRATAARRVARARADLLALTRKQLAAEIGIPRDEVDSILVMLDSELDASVRELFA